MVLDSYTTWDGLPISEELPHGVAVMVYRLTDDRNFEVLMLHRAHRGVDYEGDWAWTPPSGSRFPGEPILECVKRELYEEVGLSHTAEPTDHGTEEWHWFRVSVQYGQKIELIDPEHDRFEWLTPDEATRRCEPVLVKDCLRAAIAAVRAELDAV